MSFRFPNKECNYQSGPCFSNPRLEYITSTADKNIELQCFIFNANFSKIIITWWKEGSMRELTLGSTVSNSRYFLPRLFYEDWTLLIRNATPSDSGVYICQINLLNLKEKFFKVDIKNVIKPSKPSIASYQYAKDEGMKLIQVVKISEKRPPALGEEFILQCLSTFSTITTDSSVLWLHNGSNKYSNQKDDVQITMQWLSNNTLISNLIIPKLSLQHTGFWTCVQYSTSSINYNYKYTFTLTVPENASILSWSDQSSSVNKLPINCFKQLIVFVIPYSFWRIIFYN